MPLAPPRPPALSRARRASLILTGLVLPGTSPDRPRPPPAATTNIAQRQDRHRVLHRERELPRLQRGRRQHRHPLVQRLLRPAVARGRPRLLPVHLPGHPELGGRLRQGLPDPDLRRQLHLDHHLLHHHRHRRHPDPHRHRHRPVHPHVRHRPRHPVRLLPVGVPGLRPRIRRRRHRLHRAVQHAELRPERLRLRPEHVQLDHPDHAQQRLQHAEAQPVRHPALRAAVQAGHLHAPRTTSATTPRSRASGRTRIDVTINGDVTVDSFDGTGNATQNFWRSAENLAINPVRRATTAGPSPRPAPFRADGRPRRPRALPGQLRLRQRRLHRRHARSPARRPACRSSSGTPRTATSAAGAARCGTWCSPA